MPGPRSPCNSARRPKRAEAVGPFVTVALREDLVTLLGQGHAALNLTLFKQMRLHTKIVSAKQEIAVGEDGRIQRLPWLNRCQRVPTQSTAPRQPRPRMHRPKNSPKNSRRRPAEACVRRDPPTPSSPLGNGQPKRSLPLARIDIEDNQNRQAQVGHCSCLAVRQELRQPLAQLVATGRGGARTNWQPRTSHAASA